MMCLAACATCSSFSDGFFFVPYEVSAGATISQTKQPLGCMAKGERFQRGFKTHQNLPKGGAKLISEEFTMAKKL